MIPLEPEERVWYGWLVRELLNAAAIAPTDELRDRVLAALDDLFHELLARC